jgi:hypothetical protein
MANGVDQGFTQGGQRYFRDFLPFHAPKSDLPVHFFYKILFRLFYQQESVSFELADVEESQLVFSRVNGY